MTAALEVRGLSVSFGRTEIVRDVSLAVDPGQVVGVVGPNGAGKTTLVDAVTGFVRSSGTVSVGGRRADHLRPHRRADLGLGRTFQSLELFEDLTVGENLAAAAEAHAARRRGAGTAFDGVARAAARADVDDVVEVLPGRLSHGRRKQVALGRALAGAPTVLLLDEPAAGLDGPARSALAVTLRGLAEEGIAVVLVDHDVNLVFGVCDEVTVLDGGRVVAQGPAAKVRADPAVAAAWLGPLGHAGHPAAPRATGAGDVGSRPPVLELAGASSGWGGAAVVHEVDLVVAEGEVVALLGANGAGKTTTLLTVAGMLPALGGAVRVGGQAVVTRPDRMAGRGVALAPQDRGVLAGLTVGEQLRLAAGPGRTGRSGTEAALDHLPALRPLLARRAGLLSGGEQQQLSLARAVATRPRLLLVDELSLGLAPVLVDQALATLRALADDGMAVLVVEQFAPVALGVAHRAYVLRQGRVVLSGAAPHLAADPAALEAAYLGARP